ncbi:MAG TPA: ABC transporter ATP-binding protein [Saprospiraceae bacterium]|jgi:lipopolysaccharide transport system ATP-binding protein|nr:ABC transporter ATP-binding protein [Saprospiraceae bacterium]
MTMSKDEILVDVTHVSKKFSRSLNKGMWYGLKDLGSAVFGSNQDRSVLRDGEFWSVKDVSFSLRRGECLGLIGRNGAGKSTLLKMLNGLIRPDEGTITMRGKIGALIELSAGFNPLLSGRENVYVNGQLLGFSKKEIDQKFKDIIDFAEIGEFIDSAVQNYSSGMKVRLGFAVAAQMEPDVLLIDEVLAVGDMGFVLKCLNKMDELRTKTAMIFVSHNMPMVSRMCSRICLLKEDKTTYQSDDVGAGITQYYGGFRQESGSFQGTDKVEIKNIMLESEGHSSSEEGLVTVHHGKDLILTVDVICHQPVHQPKMHLAFYDQEQRNFAEVFNFFDHVNAEEIVGPVRFRAVIPNIPFSQGQYSITIGLNEYQNGQRNMIFRYQSAVYFLVESKQHGWSPIQLNPVWELITHPTTRP